MAALEGVGVGYTDSWLPEARDRLRGRLPDGPQARSMGPVGQGASGRVGGPELCTALGSPCSSQALLPPGGNVGSQSSRPPNSSSFLQPREGTYRNLHRHSSRWSGGDGNKWLQTAAIAIRRGGSGAPGSVQPWAGPLGLLGAVGTAQWVAFHTVAADTGAGGSGQGVTVRLVQALWRWCLAGVARSVSSFRTL